MASPVESDFTDGITLKKKVLSTPEVLAQSVANMAPSGDQVASPELTKAPSS